MPVCAGCGGSFDDEFKFCPYCGRSKPEPVKVEIQMVEQGGEFACPNCKRADQVRKVSAIIASQTQLTSAGLQKKTDLAEKLSGNLTKPVIKTVDLSGQDLFAWVFILGLIFVSCFSMGVILLIQTPEDSLSIFGLFSVAFISGCAALGLFIVAKDKYDNDKIQTEKNKKEYAEAGRKWQKAMERHKNLFYCFRCDVVLTPGEKDCFPAEQMNEILYRE